MNQLIGRHKKGRILKKQNQMNELTVVKDCVLLCTSLNRHLLPLNLQWDSSNPPVRFSVDAECAAQLDALHAIRHQLRQLSNCAIPGVNSSERDRMPWHALRDDMYVLERLLYKVGFLNDRSRGHAP